LTARDLRLVLQILSDDQKAARVQCSRSLLVVLRTQETGTWDRIMTLDKSWFSYKTLYFLGFSMLSMFGPSFFQRISKVASVEF
jgi:hypothetical protein